MSTLFPLEEESNNITLTYNLFLCRLVNYQILEGEDYVLLLSVRSPSLLCTQ